jgi:hypothetical protein
MGQNAEIVNFRASWDSYATPARTCDRQVHVITLTRQQIKSFKEGVYAATTIQCPSGPDDPCAVGKSELSSTFLLIPNREKVPPHSILDHRGWFGSRVIVYDVTGQALTKASDAVRSLDSVPKRRHYEREPAGAEGFEIIVEVNHATSPDSLGQPYPKNYLIGI